MGDNLKAVLQNYPNLDIKEALQCVVDIENILKTDEIDIFDFLNEFQGYILNMLKNNINNDAVLKMLESHIKLIQKAKRRLKASMSAKVVLESLFLDIACGV